MRTAAVERAPQVAMHPVGSRVPRLYTPDEVLAITRVSWRTIQRWMAADDHPFPAVRRLGPRTPMFLAESVDAWILENLNITEPTA